MPESAAPVVVVDGVSKTFSIPREHVHTLKEKALHPFRSPGADEIRALQDVSVSVQPGEFFGIVGRNGSGKSTLLKCLAGIYKLDAGDVYINGRMSTFIELGVGFNPDLAAYDNVMLNAAMLGVPAREAKARYDGIMAFAELEEYAELKLKNYSSGMLVRLAFSVMIQVDADILLIDEVLAVGDAAFQQKCFDEFARIRRDGTTVILVTHDMSSVRRFCDRAMLLENGRMVEIGDPERVGNRYLDLNFSAQAREEAASRDEGEVVVADAPSMSEPGDRWGDGAGEILAVWVEDEDGEPSNALMTGQRFALAMRVRFHQAEEDPIFGVLVETDQRVRLMGLSNFLRDESGDFAAGEEVVVRFVLQAVMAPGRYFVSPGLAHSGQGNAVMDRREQLISFVVTATEYTDGLISPERTMTYERTGVRPPAADTGAR